jgi:signal transduction histidine kinase
MSLPSRAQPARFFNTLFVPQRWIVVSMLGALQFAVLGELSEQVPRALFVTHLSLFLVWQPFFTIARRISPIVVLLLLLAGLAVYLGARGWIIVVWLALLIGILGGQVFGSRMSRQRLFYLFAVAHLLALLLLWAVPVLITEDHVPRLVAGTVRYGLLSLLIVMLLLPWDENTRDANQGLDVFYSLVFFQLVVLLVLGTIAVVGYSKYSYYQALFLTILAASVVLLALGALWNPWAGFTGLRIYFSRYLLSVGLPFEKWLEEVVEYGEAEPDPDDFLRFAAGRIVHHRLATGIVWRTSSGGGELGLPNEYAEEFVFRDLKITLYTAVRMSPALGAHAHLVTQLLADFYEGKRREQRSRNTAYMAAIHATGARLTHDLKNILQSLYSLIGAVTLPGTDANDFAQLMLRRLPQFAERLQGTLDDLENPARQRTYTMVPARAWWEGLMERYAGGNVRLSAEALSEAPLPRELFDSVAENLLQNALRKKSREPGIQIRLQFHPQDDMRLVVCDSGKPVDPAVAEGLFEAPVSSRSGMGIGLFLAGWEARQAGYELKLARNEAGNVCFALKKAAPGERPAEHRPSSG